jgi:hypothetical protein
MSFFKFGNSHALNSLKCITLPIVQMTTTDTFFNQLELQSIPLLKPSINIFNIKLLGI